MENLAAMETWLQWKIWLLWKPRCYGNVAAMENMAAMETWLLWKRGCNGKYGCYGNLAAMGKRNKPSLDTASSPDSVSVRGRGENKAIKTSLCVVVVHQLFTSSWNVTMPKEMRVLDSAGTSHWRCPVACRTPEATPAAIVLFDGVGRVQLCCIAGPATALLPLPADGEHSEESSVDCPRRSPPAGPGCSLAGSAVDPRMPGC
ncbi:hypothetical protein QTP86_002828 [Hemibagrus guttatus]|nr:hypothetical protein QTP86_002828 [Hemibagrus guttatus]